MWGDVYGGVAMDIGIIVAVTWRSCQEIGGKANCHGVQNSVCPYVDLHKIALLRCRSLKQVTGGPGS